MQRWFGIHIVLFIILFVFLLTRGVSPAKTERSTAIEPAKPAMSVATSAVPQENCEDIKEISVQQDMSRMAVFAGIQSNPFTMTASVSGLICYFAGQTNALGQTMLLNDKRYLGGERLHVVLDFSSDPGQIQIDFCNRTWRFYGYPGRTHYETSIIVPPGSPTLSWDDNRLADSLTLTIWAAARGDPALQDEVTIKPIEITGDVRQILRVQPVRWLPD